MKAGDIVRLKERYVEFPEERDVLYTVEKVNGDRAYFLGMVDMGILPVECLPVEMMEMVKCA